MFNKAEIIAKIATKHRGKDVLVMINGKIIRAVEEKKVPARYHVMECGYAMEDSPEHTEENTVFVWDTSRQTEVYGRISHGGLTLMDMILLEKGVDPR